MQSNNEAPKTFDSSNLIFFLLTWRKPLIIVSFAAAVISAGVSFMLQEKYLSTVVMFPSLTSSISKSVMIDDPTGKQDIVQFGEEEQAEQMLQILNSDKIRGKIIAKYDLMKHYGINYEGDSPLTSMHKEFESNVSFKRTEFQSVRIDVLDHDRDTAAMIANDIAALFDSTKNAMQHQRAKAGLRVIEQEYFEKLAFMKSMDDSLTKIRQNGVVEYEKQAEMLSQEYYKVIGAGKSNALKKLNEEKEILAKYGSAYLSLTENLEFEREHLALLRAKWEEAKVDAVENIPHKFVVNDAWPAEKKAYPIRWLIVVVSTFSAFLLTILVIIGIDNLKRFRTYEQEKKSAAAA